MWLVVVWLGVSSRKPDSPRVGAYSGNIEEASVAELG